MATLAIEASLRAKAVAVTGDNIAASAFGGVVEKVSGEAGPGFLGRLLIDGKRETSFRASAPTFPQEVTISFYDRRPALISAVTLLVPARSNGAPKQVEVWTSTQGPNQGYRKVASGTLKAEAEARLAFPATEAAFVKLKVLSTQKGGPLEISELAVLEGKRAGYTPLSARHPELATWDKNPRRVAQRGIDWLEPAAIAWQRRNNCYGCHSQAQVIMGLAIADRNHYVVDRETLSTLAAFVAKAQHPNGTFHDRNLVTATQFAAMAFSYADELTRSKSPGLPSAADYLRAQQKPTGEVAVDHDEAPIDQGSLMTTANAALAFDRAALEVGAEKYREAQRKALAWIATATPTTTQDEVFQALSLTRFGTPERRRVVNALVDRLRKEQNADGGWQETRSSKGSNAYATGQVLYALKAAGVSVESNEFRRGVSYLVSTQKENGAWPSINSQSKRPSEFAPTMWAVIGLAGSFRESETGSLQVVSDLEQPAQSKPSRKNVLIILDESGSMKARLGKSTRIATARAVIHELLDKIPADYNVGLRLYAHRAKAKTQETCTDTEMVLPIAPVDRSKFIEAVEKVEPRGDTPLVYSTLRAPEDLKPLGGGSVILITDGEESCGGDPKDAARALKASGVDITLDIMGFTLKGKKVEAELTALAESTGGRYFPASDRDTLLRSLSIATFRYPYAVLDKAGHSVATGTADAAPIDLKPGDYEVVLFASGRELRESVSVKASGDVSLRLRGSGESVSLSKD